jgi:hypothetical protein
MSLLMDEMRSAYRAQRGISQGAGITLVSRSGGYSASFGCAEKCAHILGSRNLEDRSGLPFFKIYTEDLHTSITKLAEQFSVALVDLVTDDKGSRFVLVWKIPSRAESAFLPDQKTEEVVADPNQSTFDLDEY